MRDVIPLFAQADFYVSTSTSEGMSNSLLEAMSASVPPITSRVSGVDDIVDDGRSGLIFDAADPDGFVRALAEAMAVDADRWRRDERCGARDHRGPLQHAGRDRRSRRSLSRPVGGPARTVGHIMTVLLTLALLSLFTPFKIVTGLVQLRPFDVLCVVMTAWLLTKGRLVPRYGIPFGLGVILPYFALHVASAFTVSENNGIREALQVGLCLLFAWIVASSAHLIDYRRLAHLAVVGLVAVTVFSIAWHISQGYWTGWKRLGDPKAAFTFLPLVLGAAARHRSAASQAPSPVPLGRDRCGDSDVRRAQGAARLSRPVCHPVCQGPRPSARSGGDCRDWRTDGAGEYG